MPEPGPGQSPPARATLLKVLHTIPSPGIQDLFPQIRFSLQSTRANATPYNVSAPSEALNAPQRYTAVPQGGEQPSLSSARRTDPRPRPARGGTAAAAGGQYGCVANGLCGGLGAGAAGKGPTAKPASPAAHGEQSAQRGRGRLVQRGGKGRGVAGELRSCCELRVNSMRGILRGFQKSGRRAFLGRDSTVCLTLVVCLPPSAELPLNLRVKAAMKAGLQGQ